MKIEVIVFIKKKLNFKLAFKTKASYCNEAHFCFRPCFSCFMIQSLLQAAVKHVSRQDHIKVARHWTSKTETFDMLFFDK